MLDQHNVTDARVLAAIDDIKAAIAHTPLWGFHQRLEETQALIRKLVSSEFPDYQVILDWNNPDG